MSSERKFRDEKHVRYGDPDIRRADGRYVRWSWRYKTWQRQCPVTQQWFNIRPEQADAAVAAGLRVGCHGGDAR